MRIIGNAGKARKVQAVASGALASGDTVVVNSDGTVSVVSGATTSIGSKSEFLDAGPRDPKVVYDTNSNKVVVVYQDFPDGQDGTATVGTVSGNSISFGTPVEFDSNYSERDAGVVFDPDTNTVVISYGGRFSYGTAIVGTVSGNSISFGTKVVFNSAATTHYRASYDTVNNKVVIAYSNSSEGSAIVGTVSGTSISFGAENSFNGFSDHVTPVYDVASGKTVVFYQDRAGSGYGKAVVGTISGTSISFGTTTTFHSASTVNIDAAYEPNAGKIVVAYEDTSVSTDGTGAAIVGTVSGSNITFGSSAVVVSDVITQMAVAYDPASQRAVFSYKKEAPNNNGTLRPATLSGTSLTFEDEIPLNDGEVGSFQFKPAYDPDTGQLIYAFRDDEVTNDPGNAVLVKIGYTSLTSENFIGTAASGTPDGKAAKINLKGAVDENQSGLTAGQSYYVQTDGTLGTTPDDPSVFAGTAVAANKLIVKG